MLLINAYAHAYHFEKDGIYYNILSGKDKTVEVTFPATPDSQKPNTNYNGDIEIPETVVFNSNTYTVTSISSKAFMSSALISVSIPSTVTTIEYETFYNCSSLENISLPNTLTNINGNAFYGCSSLKSIIIPNSVRYVSERAFMGCTSLESAVLSESMNIIGDHLFSDCHSLKSIAIPSTIESIECGAFASCTSLTSLIIPNSKISIQWFAFWTTQCNNPGNSVSSAYCRDCL